MVDSKVTAFARVSEGSSRDQAAIQPQRPAVVSSTVHCRRMLAAARLGSRRSPARINRRSIHSSTKAKATSTTSRGLRCQTSPIQATISHDNR